MQEATAVSRPKKSTKGNKEATVSLAAAKVICVDAAVASFFSEWMWFSRADFLVGKENVCALLFNDFGKSLAKHWAASQLATGQRHVSDVAPFTKGKPRATATWHVCFWTLGALFLKKIWSACLECHRQKVRPITFRDICVLVIIRIILMGFHFLNVFCGLFTGWLCEINSMNLANVQ